MREGAKLPKLVGENPRGAFHSFRCWREFIKYESAGRDSNTFNGETKDRARSESPLAGIGRGWSKNRLIHHAMLVSIFESF